MKKYLLTGLLALVVNIRSNAQTFVDAFAVGANNGTSWTNAYNDLGNAIYNSTSGDTIWVKEGDYNPSFDTTGSVPSDATQRTFWLKNGVVLYGGFTGTETSLSQRDPVNHKATLTGDFTASIYARHVVTIYANIDSTAIMDGFSVANGVASVGVPLEHGGGMLLFGDAWFYNVHFSHNTAYQHGGAVYANNSRSTFVNCRFTSNTTLQYDGAAANFNNSDVEMYNCVFQSNTAGRFGAAITSVSSDVKLQNCTFEGNTSPNNVFQHSTSGNLRIYNCVFNNNTVSTPIGTSGGTIDFTESVIPMDVSWGILCATCTPGTPTFVNVATGNLALTSTSIGVDETLTNSYINPYVDIVGNPRIAGTSRDMGAYEYTISTAGINNDLSEVNLHVFPNPTSQILNIDNEGEIEAVSIYNTLGELIQTETKKNFSVENLSSGMYILQIKTKNGTYSKRFIKE